MSEEDYSCPEDCMGVQEESGPNNCSKECYKCPDQSCSNHPINNPTEMDERGR
jgi:hypothetical protein